MGLIKMALLCLYQLRAAAGFADNLRKDVLEEIVKWTVTLHTVFHPW